VDVRKPNNRAYQQEEYRELQVYFLRLLYRAQPFGHRRESPPSTIASRIIQFSWRFFKFQLEFEFLLFKASQNPSSCRSVRSLIRKRAIKGDILSAKEPVQSNFVRTKAFIRERAHVQRVSTLCARQ
jgi:hypothetical protein